MVIGTGIKRSWWQFSLRELVAITVIVAFAVGYWLERNRHRQVVDRLDKLITRPFVVVHQGDPIHRYSVNSGISFMGILYLPNGSGPLPDLRMTGTLLRADTLEVIKEIPVGPNFHIENETYDFAATFQQSAKTQSLGLKPGTYLVRVDCFSNGESIATGFCVLQAVDTRAKSE